MTTRARRLFLIAVAAVALIAAACGNDSGDEPVMQPPPAADDGGDGMEGAEDAEPNPVDIEFTRAMIVHHQQAIEMSALAEDRADSDEVRVLAARIEAAQQPEIDLMLGWLEVWGEDPPGGGMDMDGMDHDGMGMDDADMGMMTQQDMADLDAASGPEFDRMFLAMMIEHHRGAIAMAREVQATGSHPDVLQIAGQVIVDQEAEVQEMEQLLAEFQ
jgi:uncharacterized protein (DUF305 family)